MFCFCMVSADDSEVESSNSVIENCIKLLGEGKKEAMELLYKHTSVSVYSFSLSMLKNPHDAEDILHDCYINIWNAAPTYKSFGKPMAWILTIARNLCLMKLREGKRLSDVPQEDWDKHLPFTGMPDIESRTVIEDCLRSLSDQEREIIILHAVSGFKFREISEFLIIPISTVLSKYHRAIKKLKKLM